jgi:hypothetical protein
MSMTDHSLWEKPKAPKSASENRFCYAVDMALRSQTTKYLVLGDGWHGAAGLKSLAAAIKAGKLRHLHRYRVKTVLIEGARRGEETTLDHGTLSKAIKILSKKGVRVLGCEDDRSLSTDAEGKEMYKDVKKYGNEFHAKLGALMDRRMPDANESWYEQAVEAPPKVIICCGTSHLPTFRHPQHGHIGLIKRLSQMGGCLGYAVESSNTGNPYTYIPENKPGSFGVVEAIGAFEGWNQL